MHTYDPRQQFIDGLERYVSGIETDDGLHRLAEHVSNYHDRLPVGGLRARERDRVAASPLHEQLSPAPRRSCGSA